MNRRIWLASVSTLLLVGCAPTPLSPSPSTAMPTPVGSTLSAAPPSSESDQGWLMTDLEKALSADVGAGVWTTTPASGTPPRPRFDSGLHTAKVAVEDGMPERVRSSINAVLARHGFHDLSEFSAIKGTGFLTAEASDGRGATLTVRLRDHVELQLTVV